MQRLRTILANPIVGFAPFIAFSIITGPGRFEIAAATALALALLTIGLGRLTGNSVKSIDLIAILLYAGLTIAAPFMTESTVEWFERWAGELSNIALVVFALGTIAVGRPFTLEYAREEATEEEQSTPVFFQINLVLTWVWALAFIVSAVSGFVGDEIIGDQNNIWTGWVIQVGAMIVAIQFTEWYPDVAVAKAFEEQGLAHDPAPPVQSLLLPLAGYLIPVGVISLINGDPWPVGVGLIVVGSLVTNNFRDPSDDG